MTKETRKKLKAAKSAEEVLAIAKEEGKEMTVEQARKMFEDLHTIWKLSDDALEKVAGDVTDDEFLKIKFRIDEISDTIWDHYHQT